MCSGRPSERRLAICAACKSGLDDGVGTALHIKFYRSDPNPTEISKKISHRLPRILSQALSKMLGYIHYIVNRCKFIVDILICKEVLRHMSDEV